MKLKTNVKKIKIIVEHIDEEEDGKNNREIRKLTLSLGLLFTS
jgi:hypothetical protein